MNAEWVVGGIFGLSTIITVFFILVKPSISFSWRGEKKAIETYFIGALLCPILYLLPNTWSMFLFIGNPTNILLASAFQLDFGGFFIRMFFPTLLAGLSSVGMLFIIFRKELSLPFQVQTEQDPRSVLNDKGGAILGVAFLFITIFLLSIAPYLRWVIWIPAFVMADCLFLFLLVKHAAVRLKNKRNHILTAHQSTTSINLPLVEIFKKMPWAVIPFALSLFVTIGAMNLYGISGWAANAFNSIVLGLPFGNIVGAILVFGVISTCAANILNNIPMSVFFVGIVQELPPPVIIPALYSVVIGSNLGALLTPIGALAGIMWMTMLKGKYFSLTFNDFVKVCLKHTPLVLIFALGGLAMTFL